MGSQESGQSSTNKDMKLYQQEFTEGLLSTQTIKFSIEAVLLKPNVPFYVQAALGDQARFVNLVFDPNPPEAAIFTLTPIVDVSLPRPEAKFVIKFSERIVPKGSDFGSQFCDSNMLPMSTEVGLSNMMAASLQCSSIKGKWNGAILLSGASGGKAVFDKPSAQIAVHAYLK